MRNVVLVLIFMLPVTALAGQYKCLGKGGPEVTLQASSEEEAHYKYVERYPDVRPRCWNLYISPDIFVRSPSFSRNAQLRPYIPSDLKSNGKPEYLCDSSGGFKADKEPSTGSCSVFISSSPSAEWRIRGINSGAITKVWRKTQGTWELWVEFAPPPNLYSVIDASPQARQYAASHGASPQSPSSQQGNQADNPTPSSPMVNPNPNPNPVDDVFKKGVGDLLRRLGQ